MRNWKVIDKFPIRSDDGKVTHTLIQLATDGGSYANFSEKVIGDHRQEGDATLIKLALDGFFKSEFADRAMAESVQKIDELDVAVKEAKKFTADATSNLNELSARLDEAEQERKARFDTLEKQINAAVKELTEIIMSVFDTTAEEEVVENEELN